jgi:TPR repeat protein
MAAAEKAKLESEALAGSPEAAQSLMSYYSLKRPNTQEAMYWAHIEAENGSAVGMYNYGFYLSKDADPRNQARAKFWLEQADKNGAPLAENLLKQMEAKQ